MFGVVCRRNWALRLSIVLNVCVLLYVCAHFGAVSGPWVEDSSGWSSSAASATGTVGSSELLYGTATRASAGGNGTTAASAGPTHNSEQPVQEKARSSSSSSAEQQQQQQSVPAAAVMPAAAAAVPPVDQQPPGAVDFKREEPKTQETQGVLEPERRANQTVGYIWLMVRGLSGLVC